MSLNFRSLILLLMIFALTLSPYIQVEAKDSKKPLPEGKSVLWNEPADLTVLDIFYGPSGKELQREGNFTFIKEAKNGSQTQFIVSDQQGDRWRVKLGKEAQPETVATRLLWAAGYFVDETYYLPEMKVSGIKGQLSSAPAGSVKGDTVYGA